MLIYVCSPLRGDIELNKENALLYCEYVFEKGYYPIAPHVQLSWLDDNNELDRIDGMKAGLVALKECDELWAFGEYISDGMAEEIRYAEQSGIPIRHITR